jgi:hypothetical protein
MQVSSTPNSEAYGRNFKEEKRQQKGNGRFDSGLAPENKISVFQRRLRNGDW